MFAYFHQQQVMLYLLIILLLLNFTKCDILSLNDLNSTVNPEIQMKNCTIGESCTSSVNSTIVHYYSVQYSYDPTSAVRVMTNIKYDANQDSPIFVVVRQVLGVISWTLPYVFPNGMIYSSVARILCSHNELNRTQPHQSLLFIEISTSNIQLIDYSIRLEIMNDYLLNAGASKRFTVSPSMPVYYKFVFPTNRDTIFIEVESSDTLCASVSVQSFSCPVYDVGEIGFKQGHYQTMSKSSSFNVYFDEFTNANQFLIVFTVKPTDTDCLNVFESADIEPAAIVDMQRDKNATVTIHLQSYSYHLFIVIFSTIGMFLLIYFCAFLIMCRRQDLYDEFALDQIAILQEPITRELEVRCSNSEQQSGISPAEENLSTTDNNNFVRHLSFIPVINASTNGFVTVSSLALKQYEYLKQKFRMYPQTALTIAIFYALPVIQLVLQYQLNIDSTGNEDICYFNFLCTRKFVMLTAFNNILSNVGYCLLGILFFIIVVRRNSAYIRCIKKHSIIEKEYGIPQHFGLFYAMAIALFMEGVLSACYHVCPSKQNFQFDTSFMFIMSALYIIKIYQTRHPDINPHSSGVFIFLAIIIFINVIGVYYDKQLFWIIYCVVHIIACFTFTAKIYYMGKLKISFRIHAHLYQLITKNGLFSRPRYLNRVGILIAANIVNISFALFGVIRQPESFPNHLLFVFLGNLALYLIYYILMKIIHKECLTNSARLCLFLSVAFWTPSLYFFLDEVKNYEVQPALSRTLNQRCILLNTYDAHDIWHLLSSFGLFFSFLLILIIDDDVRYKHRSTLAAF